MKPRGLAPRNTAQREEMPADAEGSPGATNQLKELPLCLLERAVGHVVDEPDVQDVARVGRHPCWLGEVDDVCADRHALPAGGCDAQHRRPTFNRMHTRL